MLLYAVHPRKLKKKIYIRNFFFKKRTSDVFMFNVKKN